MNLRLLCGYGGRGMALMLALSLFVPSAPARTVPVDDLRERTSQQVAAFLDEFSDVKCTEVVTQEKLRKDGKTELHQQSTYDYLVIMSNAGGELNLNESRLALKVGSGASKKNVSLLVSNGFATMFLIFHPYYADGFRFTETGAEVVEGRSLSKIHFEHIRGRKSPVALALRGREFALEISGDAWIDSATGNIVRMTAGVNQGLEDIGMKSMLSDVRFAAVSFRGQKEVYWFPAEASVEVETPRQHWRNHHQFTDYKKFSVSTEEHVSTQ